ncbi:MAG: inorganic pyrophosphatase Ppa [Desulfobacteraceae bacterium]|nr:MAG: inorganic pyrophosphatase Ppa [Desulfobacteraceae bacterium]
MGISDYLQGTAKLEIQAYEKPKELSLLRETHIAFSGAPRKHPFDPKKVFLIVDPFSANTFFYEFRTEDVTYLEELPSIVNLEGKTIPMVRLWIRKTSIAVRCTPFIVGETGFTS